ncbi:MAG: hypothetical protein Edafosvirus15_14 [Edafosvirus sp.]|uniref:Phosphoribosyltransferase domain-containing protein n=1 Tax=Edafosvirus sp. TaxID=2487765 RepID=A0A3G4ZY44_9VIRU|nr:MAG: hypothetical protein Edafosvirus15_14 [Edafosvirus sp.]
MEAQNNIIKIKLLVFLYYWIRNRSFNKVMMALDKKYGKGSNYLISLFCKKLYIVQTTQLVKSVLNTQSQAKLTCINKIFFKSHGHKYGIGNLGYNEKEMNLWKNIHDGLKTSINIGKLTTIMKRHANILTHKYNFTYYINDVVDEFILNVWSQYCFGDNVDIVYYGVMRTKLLSIIKKTFHNNPTNLIPIISPIICSIKRLYYKNEIREVDKMIQKLIDDNEGGFIHTFKDYLKSKPEILNVSEITLDNAFLSVLVYDFIHMMILESMVKIAKESDANFEYILSNKLNYLKNAFLFPFRFRKIGQNYDIFRKNDYVIINLVESNMLFSYGPRTCVGIGFSNKFYEVFYDILKNYKIKDEHKNKTITYSTNANIPTITSKHKISLTMDPNILGKLIPSFDFKGLSKFYRVEGITENTELYKYTICKMNELIAQINATNKNKINGILTAESRGYLFACPVACMANIPLYTMRKGGKIAGPTITEIYQKGYDNKEILELSVEADVKEKNIVIIDDGIASGATTIAMYNLANKAGVNIVAVIVAVKHNYTDNKYDRTPVYNIFNL